MASNKKTRSFLFFLVIIVLIAISVSIITGRKWKISLGTILPHDKPANKYIEKIIAKLAEEDENGPPISLEYFKNLCRRASPTVYVDALKKYATPVSISTQKKEHADYSSVFMKEKFQRAGANFLRSYKSTLKKAQYKYGVHRKDIVSILMWESGLGEYVGDYKVFNIFMGQILYLEKARKLAIKEIKKKGNPNSINFKFTDRDRKRFERIKNRAVDNLVALIKISKRKNFDPLSQRGSWGGAIGYVQFMPYRLNLAVDGNNDKRVDLCCFPDAIFSVANYLKEFGYKMDYKSRKKGIHGYNPINSYVHGVIKYADAIWKRYQKRG